MRVAFSCSSSSIRAAPLLSITRLNASSEGRDGVEAGDDVLVRSLDPAGSIVVVAYAVLAGSIEQHLGHCKRDTGKKRSQDPSMSIFPSV